jgi:hypothetical protein
MTKMEMLTKEPIVIVLRQSKITKTSLEQLEMLFHLFSLLHVKIGTLMI